MRLTIGAFCLTAGLAFMASTVTPARADEWNKETRLEVREPLEIPGKTLTPGTYVFKLLDSEANRNIVEVFSEDASGKQTLVTTTLAIPAYTMETPDKALIRLEERPSSSPQAIHSWFYPGDNYGWEFVYPKAERLLSADQIPAQQPTPIPAVVPPLPEPPAAGGVPEPPVEPPVVEQAVSESTETLVLLSETSLDAQGDADRMLPDTSGHSATELAAGLTMLALGLATVFLGRRRLED